MRKGEVLVSILLGIISFVCILVLNNAFIDNDHFTEAIIPAVLGGGLIGTFSLLAIHTFGFLGESPKKIVMTISLVLAAGLDAYFCISANLSDINEIVCLPVIVGIVFSMIGFLVLGIIGIVYAKVSGRGKKEGIDA